CARGRGVIIVFFDYW
nr:immunoglobulin heavy chain junction region [Macaca mulatta]MOX61617.1 immunoglobulin heavy chain junction region [Macaca mulatta]MOX62546.1 immunoglobulin heavy chain junction region [Macaca mulatta]MOX67034.1 immunoglobulin heavy chain junction region [Macaca mulatta]